VASSHWTGRESGGRPRWREWREGNNRHEVAEAGEGLEPGILVGGAEEDEQDNVQDEYPEFACGMRRRERGRKARRGQASEAGNRRRGRNGDRRSLPRRGPEMASRSRDSRARWGWWGACSAAKVERASRRPIPGKWQGPRGRRQLRRRRREGF